jgi:hypothetical protein
MDELEFPDAGAFVGVGTQLQGNCRDANLRMHPAGQTSFRTPISNFLIEKDHSLTKAANCECEYTGSLVFRFKGSQLAARSRGR